MSHFKQVSLITDCDGRARFIETVMPWSHGNAQTRLSALLPSGGMQLRESPVGFSSAFHCTQLPQWVFILRGMMEIGLQDGSSRRFGPGEHFCADLLPPGAVFDPAVHGHCSRQCGDVPLQTLFARA
jgi:hypothetical protein